MSPAGHLDDATLAAIHRWLEYRTWHSQVPGAQVAIGLAGEVVLSGAYGFADLEGQVVMRTDNLFRIASHSKTFTSTLVLQLVEQGGLGVDDPFGRHLLAVAEDPVLGDLRIRELLEHTSGLLRDGLDADYWQFERPFPDREQLLDDRAAEYAVGYSGLHQSTKRSRLAQIDTGAMDAATGFTSTATDLVRYFTAHRFGDSRLLNDRTKRLQQRHANATDPESDTAGG